MKVFSKLSAHFRGLPAKRQRLLFVFAAVVSCMVGVQLVLTVFRDNIVFFYTPLELQAHTQAKGRLVRLGGLVETGSLKKTGPDSIAFTATDGQARMQVAYSGMLPTLFREGQGMIAEGVLAEDGRFQAKRILAKHDERYMPKEVAERLKRSGYWRSTGKPAPP